MVMSQKLKCRRCGYEFPAESLFKYCPNCGFNMTEPSGAAKDLAEMRAKMDRMSAFVEKFMEDEGYEFESEESESESEEEFED